MLLSPILKLLPLAACLRSAYAADADDDLAGDGSAGESQSLTLDVKVTTAFPEAEIFGVKLVNGHPTSAVMSVTNNEANPVTLRFIGGNLWTALQDQESRVIRNLSSTVYDSQLSIPPGESESFTYKFTTDMHPQDVRLQLIAGIVDSKNSFYPVLGYNETVSIVEAPSSILDPKNIFLYLILTGFFGAVGYGVYSYWIVTLFPQQKRRSGGKGPDRGRVSSKGTKKVDPVVQATTTGADGAAVTPSKGYDESWIPLGHLKRPESKRIKSGTPTGVRVKKT